MGYPLCKQCGKPYVDYCECENELRNEAIATHRLLNPNYHIDDPIDDGFDDTWCYTCKRGIEVCQCICYECGMPHAECECD